MASVTIGWPKCLVLATLFFTSLSHADGLTQQYCASVNTGSDFGEIYGTWTSLGSCQTNCTDAGTYAYAVVQGNECWCSNETPASSVRVSTSKCDATCPGYPPENCGNAANSLFGYMALGPAPSGTAGGLTSSAPTSTPAPATSSAPAPSVVTSQQIIVTTQVSVSTQMVSIIVTPTPVVSASPSLVPPPVSASRVITTSVIVQTSYLILSPTQAPPGSTAAPVTIVQTVATTEQVTVVPTPAPSTPSPESTTIAPSVVTLQGKPTTQYVTSIISATPAATTAAQSSPSLQSHAHSTSLSGGAIAGIVIGTLAGLALLAALLFLCCFRRRHDDDTSTTNELNRNTSVLSRVGLVRNRGHSPTTSPAVPDVPPSMTQRTPTLPLFQDSRLNQNIGSWRGEPATGAAGPGWGAEAGTWRGIKNAAAAPAGPGTAAGLGIAHAGHGSQESLSSIQDHRDYSRPLEVRNPDIDERD